jgi:hypothetical protein
MRKSDCIEGGIVYKETEKQSPHLQMAQSCVKYNLEQVNTLVDQWRSKACVARCDLKWGEAQYALGLNQEP